VNKHKEKNERKKRKRKKKGKYTDGLLLFGRIFSSRSPKQ